MTRRNAQRACEQALIVVAALVTGAACSAGCQRRATPSEGVRPSTVAGDGNPRALEGTELLAASAPTAKPIEPPDARCLPACRVRGACRERNSRCIADDARQCANSENCRAFGACGLVEEVCAPSADEHCEKSDKCREEGTCGLTPKGRCAATKPEHCSQARVCKATGACKPIDDEVDEKVCSVETHDQCAATDVCRDEKKCWYMPSRGGPARCIAGELRVGQRFALTEARHGVSGELRLSEDSRFPKNSGKRDYLIDEAEPRAAAVLSIRAADGTIRDATELYPAVAIVKDDLGAGTDAFLATERIACSAGHWCGAHTILFEVRNGRLVRARATASGDAGPGTDVAMTAAGGSRWKLVRGAGPPKAEILLQREGPVPPGPALVETRFFFDAGRWQSTEREFDSYDSRVNQQPGRWNGRLEFHGN